MRSTWICFAILLNAWIRRSLLKGCLVKHRSACLSRRTGIATRTISYSTSNGSLRSETCGKAGDIRISRGLHGFRGLKYVESAKSVANSNQPNDENLQLDFLES